VANSKIELDAETDVDEPKKKKQKLLQKYLSDSQIKYPVIRHSTVSDNHAYCTVCRCIGDVDEHVRTMKHAVKARDSGPLEAQFSSFLPTAKIYV